jgi:hypothetical protein
MSCGLSPVTAEILAKISPGLLTLFNANSRY